MIDIFCKAQKCYYGFLLFVKMYRKKKYPIIVKDDLMLNPLERTTHTTFELVQNKSIYLFAMRDLMNIIETSLQTELKIIKYTISFTITLQLYT